MKSALISLLLATALVGAASAKTFEEGLQYVPITPKPPVGNGDTVEVVEFFWYGCPHCRDFEPTLMKWSEGLSDNVSLVQMPVLFGGPADMHAQVFYALEAIGDLERMHKKIFDAMHVDNKKLRTHSEMEAFLAENGVDIARFNEAMQSFAVAAKVNRARTLMRRYGVRSVPAIVVDGRYRSGTGFKSYEEITEVVDFTVDKVLAERKTP